MNRTSICLFFPLALSAQDLRQAEALTAHLHQTARLHGTFTQTRHLAALSRPLISTGTLVVDRDRGVLWQVKKPLTLTFVLGPAGIFEVDGAGKRKGQASREAPMVAQMGRIVQSLLKGQWRGVEEHFTVRGTGTPQRWEITLDPRPATAPFIRQVKVQGGAFLEKIRVEEPAGDRMELAFRELRTDLPLAETEARLLALR